MSKITTLKLTRTQAIHTRAILELWQVTKSNSTEKVFLNRVINKINKELTA